MFKNIRTRIKNNEAEFYKGIALLLGAVVVVETLHLAISREAFRQVELSVDALGLTEQLIEHMQNHVY